jgi:hypothetical protein
MDYTFQSKEITLGNLNKLKIFYQAIFKNPKNKELKQIKDILNLLNHENNSRIMHTGSEFRVRNVDDNNTKRQKGLLSVLRKRYWPFFDEGSMIKEGKKRKNNNNNLPGYHKIKRTCLTYGKDHGIIVHREIEECVKKIISSGEIEISNHIDPCTQRIISFLCMKLWIPVASEFYIWDKKNNIGTSVDLLIYDLKGNGKLSIIELKTGYENEEYDSLEEDEYLISELNFLRNCPQNRHLIQLLFNMVILEKNYNIHNLEGYVVKVCSKRRGIEVFSIDELTKQFPHHMFSGSSSGGANNF